MIEQRLTKISGTLKRFEVRLLILLLIILGVGLLYKNVIVPEQHSLQRYEGAVTGNVNARSYLSLEESKLQQQLSNTKEQSALRNAETALPGDVEFDRVVEELGPIFRQSGLVEESLTPGVSNSSPPISGFSVTITATANTSSPQPLIHFLRLLHDQVKVGRGDSISASGPLWVISRINISSTGAANTTSTAEVKSTYTISGVVLFKLPTATTPS